MSLEISSELEVIVRAPLFVSDREIAKFVEEHRQWISEHIEKRRIRLANKMPILSEEEVEYLKKRAREYLPARVGYFSSLMGVSPRSVKITSAQKRLGSCSSLGSICFSYKVMQYDLDVIDYVVVHELAHLIQHNHSRAFYDVVKKYCPDYRETERRIKW